MNAMRTPTAGGAAHPGPTGSRLQGVALMLFLAGLAARPFMGELPFRTSAVKILQAEGGKAELVALDPNPGVAPFPAARQPQPGRPPRSGNVHRPKILFH